jgi:peroxiredoxin
VRQHVEAIRQLGAEVVVVVQARPDFLSLFLREQPQPFPVVADPSRAAYQAFGLESTSWKTILRPGVLWRYLRLVVRGWRPKRSVQGEDVLQLGGDFVLNREGRLVYAYRSAEPTDRPAVAELLRALGEVSSG